MKVHQIRKALFVTAAVSGLIMLMLMFYNETLDVRYLGYPREPDIQTERIVPYKVKGVVAYISPTDDLELIWLHRFEIFFGAFFIIGIVIKQTWPTGNSS